MTRISVALLILHRRLIMRSEPGLSPGFAIHASRGPPSLVLVRHPIRCNEDLEPGKAMRLLGEWGRQPWGGAEQPSHPCEGRPSTRKPS